MSSNSVRPVVFMDINIGETPAGRLKMELFSDIVPKYAQNSTRMSVHKLTYLQDSRELPSTMYRRIQVFEAARAQRE